MSKVIIGPMIGKVTHDTARVLMEIDHRREISCTVKAESGHSAQVIQLLEPAEMKSFQFTDLVPDTRYQITVEGSDCDIPSSFHTFPEDGRKLNVFAVSCNEGVDRGKHDMFQLLWKRYVRRWNRPAHLLLHIGDQVYCDSAFERGMDLMKKDPAGSAETQKKIQQGFRSRYRQVWQREHTRRVLANVSNLMIWDDHEIRDDWGSRDEDRNPDSHQHLVGRMARMVFRRYQRQLWTDVDHHGEPADGCEDHFHVFGNTGVMFVDQRGARSFEYDEEVPYLGPSQWERIESALKQDGLFESVRVLLVVTSVPLAYLGPNLSTKLAHGKLDDLKDHWAWGPYGDEQVHLLRRLRQWKQRGEGRRDLLVLGGDVHLGGHTELRHEGKAFAQQLITSPVCNSSKWRWLIHAGIRALLEKDENLQDGYRFEHSDFTSKENFAYITVRMSEEIPRPTVKGRLITD